MISLICITEENNKYGGGVEVADTVLTGGCVTCGAAVGATVGAGYVYDKTKKTNE
jgi:hypothetical protein